MVYYRLSGADAPGERGKTEEEALNIYSRLRDDIKIYVETLPVVIARKS